MMRNSNKGRFYQRTAGWCKAVNKLYELIAKFHAELIVGIDGTSRYRRYKCVGRKMLANESGNAEIQPFVS